MGDAEPIVALAVLRPASPSTGARPDAITVETLHEHAPDPAAVARVGDTLAAAGFAVGPMVGIAMAISGPSQLFEEYFSVRVAEASDGSWFAVRDDGAATRELPLSAVPADTAGDLAAVTFEEPAEPVGGDWP